MSSNHNTSSFFSSVSSANLPGSSAEKSQPWSTFHQADESLAGAKSIVVDVPTSDESGIFLRRFRLEPKCFVCSAALWDKALIERF